MSILAVSFALCLFVGTSLGQYQSYGYGRPQQPYYYGQYQPNGYGYPQPQYYNGYPQPQYYNGYPQPQYYYGYQQPQAFLDSSAITDLQGYGVNTGAAGSGTGFCQDPYDRSGECRLRQMSSASSTPNRSQASNEGRVEQQRSSG